MGPQRRIEGLRSLDFRAVWPDCRKLNSGPLKPQVGVAAEDGAAGGGQGAVGCQQGDVVLLAGGGAVTEQHPLGNVESLDHCPVPVALAIDPDLAIVVDAVTFLTVGKVTTTLMSLV